MEIERKSLYGRGKVANGPLEQEIGCCSCCQQYFIEIQNRIKAVESVMASFAQILERQQSLLGTLESLQGIASFPCSCEGKFFLCSCERGREVRATTPHWHCLRCRQIYNV